MVYQRKKRIHEQQEQLPVNTPQNNLFASPDLETDETDNSFSVDSSQPAPTLEMRWQQADKPFYTFDNLVGSRPVYPPSSAVQRRPMSPLMQAKMSVGPVGDKYEQEADHVANKVVEIINRPEDNAPVQRAVGEGEENMMQMPSHMNIQRKEMGEEEDLQMKPQNTTQKISIGVVSQLQKMPQVSWEGKEAGTVDEGLEDTIHRAKSGGQALTPDLQQSMGQAMGADFSDVKIHTDAESNELNKTIQAKAFTTGQDLFFKQGAYNPHTKTGQTLIAHELTHVVQQTGGSKVGKAEEGIQRGKDMPNVKLGNNFFEPPQVFSWLMHKNRPRPLTSTQARLFMNWFSKQDHSQTYNIGDVYQMALNKGFAPYSGKTVGKNTGKKDINKLKENSQLGDTKTHKGSKKSTLKQKGNADPIPKEWQPNDDEKLGNGAIYVKGVHEIQEVKAKLANFGITLKEVPALDEILQGMTRMKFQSWGEVVEEVKRRGIQRIMRAFYNLAQKKAPPFKWQGFGLGKKPIREWVNNNQKSELEALNCWQTVCYAVVKAGMRPLKYLKIGNDQRKHLPFEESEDTKKGQAPSDEYVEYIRDLERQRAPMIVRAVLKNDKTRGIVWPRSTWNKAPEHLVPVFKNLANFDIPAGYVVLFGEGGKHVAMSTGRRRPITKIKEWKKRGMRSKYGHEIWECDEPVPKNFGDKVDNTKSDVRLTTIEDQLVATYGALVDSVKWGPLPSFEKLQAEKKKANNEDSTQKLKGNVDGWDENPQWKKKLLSQKKLWADSAQDAFKFWGNPEKQPKKSRKKPKKKQWNRKSAMSISTDTDWLTGKKNKVSDNPQHNDKWPDDFIDVKEEFIGVKEELNNDDQHDDWGDDSVAIKGDTEWKE
ncbi:MAG: DUF4157 domain-containing protein [Cyanobacteria bacterium P01_A01_bin.123]